MEMLVYQLHIYVLYLHATIHVIYIELKLVKLKGCTCELIGQTKVNMGMNINGSGPGNFPHSIIMFGGFLQC
jgi:hypothetical protein